MAAVSGDARRALDICRRSTEVAEKNDRDCVTLPDVNEALTEMIANVKVQAIKHCSLMEQLFLKAIVSEVTRIGIEEVIFRNVFRSLQDHTSFEGKFFRLNLLAYVLWSLVDLKNKLIYLKFSEKRPLYF